MNATISPDAMTAISDELDRLRVENADLLAALTNSQGVSRDLASRITAINTELFKALDALRVERHVDRRRLEEIANHVDRISNDICPVMLEYSLRASAAGTSP